MSTMDWGGMTTEEALAAATLASQQIRDAGWEWIEVTTEFFDIP